MARTALDIKAQAKTAKGLRSKGIDLHLRKYESRTQNVVSGEVTLGSATDSSWFGSPPVGYDQSLVDGEIIKVDDAQIILSYRDTDDTVIPFVPERGAVEIVLNKDEANEEVWSIIGVKTHRAGNEPCAYECQVRRE